MLNHHMHSHISQLSRCLQCGENNGGRKKFFSRWLPQRNENNVSKTKCRMHTNSWKIKSYFVYGFNGCGGEKKKKKQNCWNSKKFFFHDLISSLRPESCSSLSTMRFLCCRVEASPHPSAMHAMAASLCIQFRNIKTIKNVSKQLFYGLKLCMMEWCGWSSSRERNVRFHFPSPTHHSPTKCLGIFFPSLSCWKALEIRKFHPFILLHLFISLLSFSQEVNSFHSPNCSPLFEIE